MNRAKLCVCICVLVHVCVFLQVATSTMDNPLLKYNAKEYFFKASLCHFIVDELNAKVEIYPPYAMSLPRHIMILCTSCNCHIVSLLGTPCHCPTTK